MNELLDTLPDLAVQYGLNLLGAIATLLVGYLLTQLVTRLVKRLLRRANVEATLVSFVSHLLYYLLLIFVIAAALNTLGIATASLVAVLGAAGLAIGLALQGSLANFAAGVLIVIFRPYKVGDFVAISGETGYVRRVEMLYTTLTTVDNKAVIVPNAAATNSTIVNFSANDHIRLDIVFGISYGDDIRKAKQIILDVMAEHPLILAEPQASAGVLALADSSVNLVARPYVQVVNMARVRLDLHEQIKLRFDAEGITIPFPQRDVHFYQGKEG